MDTSGWEDRHRVLIARLAGIAGIAFVAISLAPGGLGGPIFDNNISTPQIVDWVQNNGGGITADGFVGAVGASIVFLMFVLLVRVTGGIAAILFAITAAAIFGGAGLTPLSEPLPFYGYPFLAVTLFGWARVHCRSMPSLEGKVQSVVREYANG